MKATALISLTSLLTLIPLSQSRAFELPKHQPTQVIKCSFTEPFFALTLNLKQMSLTLDQPADIDPGHGHIIVAPIVQIAKDLSDPFLPKFEVRDENGSPLLRLSMDMQGSDGMSDMVFPFSAEYKGQLGGCYSNEIPVANPNSN